MRTVRFEMSFIGTPRHDLMEVSKAWDEESNGEYYQKILALPFCRNVMHPTEGIMRQFVLGGCLVPEWSLSIEEYRGQVTEICDRVCKRINVVGRLLFTEADVFMVGES